MTDNVIPMNPEQAEQDKQLCADILEAVTLYTKQFLREGCRGFSIVAHHPDSPSLPGSVNINSAGQDAAVVMGLEALKNDIIQSSREQGIYNDA